MKKIFAIILVIVTVLCVTACTPKVDKAEERRNYSYDDMAMHVSVETASGIFKCKYGDCDYTIYLPREGEFKLRGKTYYAKIDYLYVLIATENDEYSRAFFNVTIKDSAGEIVIKKEQFVSYLITDGGGLDLSYVSRDFRKYWRAIAEPVNTLCEE